MTTSRERASRLIALFSKLTPFEELLKIVKQDEENSDIQIPKIPDPISWTNESAIRRRAFINLNCQP